MKMKLILKSKKPKDILGLEVYEGEIEEANFLE